MESAKREYVTQDSDEVHDIVCEQCDQHGTQTEAWAFCVDCSEYMCKTCLVYHRRYVPTHSQLDHSEMPRDLNVTEKCSSHSKLLIKFYCEDCRKLACSECKKLEHAYCGNVRHISELVNYDENQKGIADIKEDIRDLMEILDEIEEKRISNMEGLPFREENAKHAMKVHREKMVKLLKDMKQERMEEYDDEIRDVEETLKDLKQSKKEAAESFDVKQEVLENNLKRAEKNMEKKIETAKSADLVRLHEIQQKNKDIASCLGNISSKLDHKQRSDLKCRTFVAVKMAEQYVKKVEEDFKKISLDNKTCDYKVEPLVDSFTYETVDTTRDFFFYKETAKTEMSEKIAVFDSRLQIQPVNYTSLCLLGGSKLLVADNKNNALFAFEDLQQDKLLSILEMPAAPWGIAKINDEKVVVTFPELGRVHFLTLVDSMSVVQTNEVKVGYECYGVAYGRDRLIVSYLDPAKVQIHDMSGNVLRCFDRNLDQTPLFSSPRHVTLSTNKRLIYVSDSNQNTLSCLTFSGKVKAIYKDNQLTAPFQMATDSAGAVYVCGRGSNNVHQLSSDLKKMKIFMDANHGLVKPVSLGLCEEENKLYVGMHSTSSIEVFNIVQE